MAQKVACTETNICTWENLSTFVKIQHLDMLKTNLFEGNIKIFDQYEEEENQFEFVTTVSRVAVKHRLKTA